MFFDMSIANDGFGHFAKFLTFFGPSNYYLFYSRFFDELKIMGKLLELQD